ncbi:hypothetical protein SALBM217S_01040 [Streptomyces griseoloalbus]
MAWSVDPARRNGAVSHLAVAAGHRRHHVGTALCEHAFAQMRDLGAEVVEIGTGGDPFHAPARALYERLGCTALPTVVYYRRLERNGPGGRTSRARPGRPLAVTRRGP